MKEIDQQLLDAAEINDSSACRALLELGADVNAVDKDGWSALYWAALTGCTDICQLLIERGANLHSADNDGWNVLHWAASDGLADICLLLIERGCNPLVKTEDGRTAFEMAIKRNHDKCAAVFRVFTAAQAARAALQELGSASALNGVAP